MSRSVRGQAVSRQRYAGAISYTTALCKLHPAAECIREFSSHRDADVPRKTNGRNTPATVGTREEVPGGHKKNKCRSRRQITEAAFPLVNSLGVLREVSTVILLRIQRFKILRYSARECLEMKLENNLS